MFEAISADAAIIDKLFHRPFAGVVHSVFRSVINFSGADDDFFCLTSTEDDGPGTIRVAMLTGHGLDVLGIISGYPVTGQEGILSFGELLQINGRNVTAWQPEQSAFPGDAAGRTRLAANLQVMRGVITENGQPGGMLAFYLGRAAGDLVSKELTRRATVMVGHLRTGDTGSALAAAVRLLGLGGGLTPSGDDFLAGLVLALELPGGLCKREIRLMGQDLAGLAGQATGQLSRVMLGYAAKGLARASMHKLVAALTAGTPDDTLTAARQVIAFGATSGTDMAVGLATGLELGLELATRD